MTATTIPTMLVDEIELRVRPGISILRDPIDCDHLWEPHLWENGKAYCGRCGSYARWINDPRTAQEIAS